MATRFESADGALVVQFDLGAGIDANLPSLVIADELVEHAYSAAVGVIGLPADPPPIHRHPHTAEAFFVAEGELTVRLDDRDVKLVPGGLVLVPAGVRHTAWNSGSRPARGLVIISPGDRAHEFELAPDNPAE